VDNRCFDRKKVLITGGLGFIGSNLAIRLVELGADVTLVDSLIPTYGGNLWNVEPIKTRVRINISDVRDPFAMKYLISGQDYLFNLAGQTSHVDSMENPETDLAINVQAQLQILEACRQHNPDVKVVFASTRQVYGRPLRVPVGEDHPLTPVDINGVHKLAAEHYHRLYNNIYGIRSVILRLTNTYGPRMRVVDARQTFLGIWIRRLLEGEPILIYGDGSQLRDYNYVDDVVDALLMAAETDTCYGDVLNLGSQEVFSLSQTAEIFLDLHPDGQVSYVPFPKSRLSIDIGDYQGDFSRIRDALGWSPKTNFRDGMRRTLEYYQQNREKYW
jgi:nucleoside-diphosphate-sugar epimerase